MDRPRSAAVSLFVLLTSLSAMAHQDAHPRIGQGGAMVMGFDQAQSTHHFFLYENGGAIDVGCNDLSNIENRDAIRAHLSQIAVMFGSGDFTAPLLVHESRGVPGTAVMAQRKSAIEYQYENTPTGGRVNLVTRDRDALGAVHEFLRYQIAEHKTGDSTVVQRR